MKATLSFSLIAFFFMASTVTARTVTKGYFAGNEFEPVGNANISAFSKEPAVVILFALDSVSADETRKFNKWYNSDDRGDVNAYGIAIRNNMSVAMFEEALFQRALTFPVFISERDLLLGGSVRVLYLDKDELVFSMDNADPDKLTAAIAAGGLPRDTATAASSTATDAAAKPLPTPIAELLGIEEPSAPVNDPVAVSEPAPETPAVSTGIYINDKYAMTVLFPPGAEYVESTTRDGAIAKLPDPAVQLDFRIWAEESDRNMTPDDYLREHIRRLEASWKTDVRVERRYRIDDDNARGMDWTYSYLRPISPAVPEAGRERVRGRIQVFVEDRVVKAAAVEGLSGHFTGYAPLVEGFIRSFLPRVKAEEGRQSALMTGAGTAFNY